MFNEIDVVKKFVSDFEEKVFEVIEIVDNLNFEKEILEVEF